MKQIFVVVLMLIALVGCDQSNPAEATSPADVEYNELSMFKTTVAAQNEVEQLQTQNIYHDSLRHGRMLGTLIRYVGLNGAQIESVKVYGRNMFETLKGIRAQVHDSLITREEARSLVIAAREQFIASVRSVLTEEQSAKLDEWIVKFWNKQHGRPPGRRGPHGPGGGRP
jgi:hypothetical protein